MDDGYRSMLNEQLATLRPGDKARFTLDIAHKAYGVPEYGQVLGSYGWGTTLKPWADGLLPKGLVATIDQHNDCVEVVRQ